MPSGGCDLSGAPCCHRCFASSLGITFSIDGWASCAIACPYDGPTPPAEVARVTELLFNLGCYEVSVGDTIDPGEGFRAFRGRDVDTSALLRKRGFPVD